MYRITITEDGGRVLTDASTDSIAMVYHSDNGCVVSSMMETDMMTAFDMVLSLDMLKENILNTDNDLRKLYKRRKRIVKGVTEVDLSLLRGLMRSRGSDDE